MTTTYHTPVAFGAAATAAVVNAPLGQLDAGLVALAAAVGASALPVGVLTGTANAGQKVLPLTATTPFALYVGAPIWIGDVGGTYEVGIIASIQAGVSLTVVTNLTNTYAAGKIVSGSPAELAAARGGEADLWSLLRKTTGTVGTSFPGSPATGDICTRSDRGGARYRWDAAAWRQVSVPTVIAFWATPSTGDRCYRSDLDKLAAYNGTRWLNVQSTQIHLDIPTNSLASLTVHTRTPNRNAAYDLWLESADCLSLVATPNDGSNYWTVAFQKGHGAAVWAELGTFNTSADTVVVVTSHPVALGALLGVADPDLNAYVLKTLTPGAIIASILIYAREVLT